MYYYDTNFKTPKRWATAALTLYVLMLGLSFLLVSFDFGRESDLSEGMLIDFGTTEDGVGIVDIQATDVVAIPETVVSSKTIEQEYVTADESDVVVQQVEKKDKPKPKEVAPKVVETPKAEPVKEAPRKVNTKALFPGRTVGSESKSEGVTKQTGNAGDLSGAPQGSHEGFGQSEAGLNYDLAGRSTVGSLPKPLYSEDASGKVVMAITVDSNGRVRTANYQLQGSTTNNAILIRAAQEAALKARFTGSESLVQAGTITYIFKMN